MLKNSLCFSVKIHRFISVINHWANCLYRIYSNVNLFLPVDKVTIRLHFCGPFQCPYIKTSHQIILVLFFFFHNLFPLLVSFIGHSSPCIGYSIVFLYPVSLVFNIPPNDNPLMQINIQIFFTNNIYHISLPWAA